MSQSPFAAPVHSPPPPPANSTTKTLLIILIVLASCGLVVCAGVGGMVWYGFRQFQQIMADLDVDWNWDWNEGYEQALSIALEDEPTLEEAVGTLQQVDFDEDRSAEGDTLWFRVTGTRGEREVVAEVAEDGQSWFENAWMLSDEGERIPLQLGAIPYISRDSGEIYRLIRGNEEVRSLVGPIEWVEDDWDRTHRDTQPDDPYEWFIVRGPEGEISLRGEWDGASGSYPTVEVEQPDGALRQLRLEPVAGPG